MSSLAKIEQGHGGLALPVTHEALRIAGDLLAHLAPLFPTIASAARSEAGATAWIKSWASQIQFSELKPWQIERGLSRLHEHDTDIPLSWPAFHRLCRDRLRDDDNYGDAEARWRKKALAMASA